MSRVGQNTNLRVGIFLSATSSNGADTEFNLRFNYSRLLSMKFLFALRCQVIMQSFGELRCLLKPHLAFLPLA